jgi:hypothetical protein
MSEMLLPFDLPAVERKNLTAHLGAAIVVRR